jgi:photosystem II stability/assembly factor-like uncharacterized protein
MTAPPPQGLARAVAIACVLALTAPPAHAQPWTPVGTIPGGYADALVVDPAGHVWAGGPNGLWRSDDHGTTWTSVKADTMPQGYQPNVIDLASGTGTTLLAGDAAAGELLASSDGGTTWTTCTPASVEKFSQPVSVAIAPGGDFYALRSLSSAGTIADGVYHSTDGGVSWALADLGGLYASNLAELFVGPDENVYAAEGVQKSAGPWTLYRSSDHGNSWTGSDLAHAPFASWPGGRTLWADAQGHVVVGCFGGIAASADTGATWPYFSNPTGAGNSAFCSIVRDALGGLLATWCGYTSGIVRSTDFGQSWQDDSAGLPPGTYRVLAVGPAGDEYTVDMAGVVYRTDPVVASIPPGAAVKFACAIAPNPCRGAADLRLRLPDGATAKVEACDIAGRRVGRWSVPGVTGDASLRLDTNGWTPGLYFVRVSAGLHSTSVKLLIEH